MRELRSSERPPPPPPRKGKTFLRVPPPSTLLPRLFIRAAGGGFFSSPRAQSLSFKDLSRRRGNALEWILFLRAERTFSRGEGAIPLSCLVKGFAAIARSPYVSYVRWGAVRGLVGCGLFKASEALFRFPVDCTILFEV